MMKSITEKINEELKKIPDRPTLPDTEKPIADSILLDDTANMSWDNMSTGLATCNLDDFIIQPLDLANLAPLLNTVSLSGTGAQSTYSIGASGAGLFQSSIYNTTNPPGYNWNTIPSKNNVNIHSGGIALSADADIMIGGRSMKKMLEGIEQRLSILVPDPKKIERYEALKQAYEHYKTLEALCNEEPKLDNQ